MSCLFRTILSGQPRKGLFSPGGEDLVMRRRVHNWPCRPAFEGRPATEPPLQSRHAGFGLGFKGTAAETAEIAAPGTFPARRSLLDTETAAGREWLPGWRAACPAKWVEQGGRGQRPQTLPLPTPRLYHCQCSWQCNRCPRPPLGCSPGAGCRGRC